MKKAILIDGNSLMFRAYYGSISQLDYYLNNDITPANAIKLMMLYMFKILNDNNYDYALIAFDHKDKNFRKEIFSDYKGKRKKIPETLIEQIEPIKKIMPLFGIKTVCISGIEADDAIGSAVKLFSKHNIKSFVYSADNDMLQLVSETCNVLQFKKGLSEIIEYNIENFSNLFHGLSPSQIVDFKSISGDSSDNIPGIKGLGPKSAIDLLLKYGNVENIILFANEILNVKTKEKIIENKEKLIFYKKLIKILDTSFENDNIDDFKLKKIKIDYLKEVIEKFKFSGFNKYFF